MKASSAPLRRNKRAQRLVEMIHWFGNVGVEEVQKCQLVERKSDEHHEAARATFKLREPSHLCPDRKLAGIVVSEGGHRMRIV